MVHDHCAAFGRPVECSSYDLMDSGRAEEHVACFVILFTECPEAVQSSWVVVVFRMSHDCAVVSYGVVFSFIIAFGFFFEDVNLVFHCLARLMVCRNKCRVYLSNNQIWVCLFAAISYLCGGTVKLNCYEISASLYCCSVLLYAVGSELWECCAGYSRVLPK